MPTINVKQNWMKIIAGFCCLFNAALCAFFIVKFSSIITYLEKLDPNCLNVKLFFVFGMEYGAGLVVLCVFIAISLRLLIHKGVGS